jgi:hypothetical protein
MVKIVYKDGDNIRALKGTILREDDFFIYVDNGFNDIRIGKAFIIKIEEGNNNV